MRKMSTLLKKAALESIKEEMKKSIKKGTFSNDTIFGSIYQGQNVEQKPLFLKSGQAIEAV